MISDRENALLQAAARIYARAASPCFDPRDLGAVNRSVEAAYTLLDAIRSQEKANLTPRHLASCRCAACAGVF